MKIREVRQVYTGKQLDEKKGMPMVKGPDGKKVPAFAADGKGKNDLVKEAGITEADDAIKAHEKAGRRVVKHSDGSYTYYDDKEKVGRKVKAGGKGIESVKYVPKGRDEDDPDYDEHGEQPAGEKRGRGRPKGSGKKLGAKSTGTSKLARGKALKEGLEDIMRLAGVHQYTVDEAEGEQTDDYGLRPEILDMFEQMLEYAREGTDVTDYIADELGDYFDDVQASGDTDLIKAYEFVREQLADVSPEEQAQGLEQAIEMIGGRETNEELKPWMVPADDPASKIPAYQRRSTEPGRQAAQGAADSANARVGASVFKSPRPAPVSEEIDLKTVLESVLDDTDDSGFMAKSNLYQLIKNAVKLHEMIADRDQLEGWVEEKITLATDYINTVRDYVEYNKVVGVEPEDMAPAQEPEMPEQPEIVKVQAPVPEAKPNPLYDNELADIVTLATRRTR